MRPEYETCSKLSDGAMLRKLLKARVTKDDSSKRTWSARLNAGQSKVFRWLEQSYNGRIVRVLESLVPMPVDWDSVTFGGISRIILTYCHEEVLCYLQALHSLWVGVLGSTLGPEMLDRKTVEILRLKMPAHSSRDADTIRALMKSKELFHRVTEDSLRQDIQNRLLECRRIITLRSFFEDTMYLEACSRGLYKLVPPRTKGSTVTLRERLRQDFAHGQNDFDTVYVQLWLSALREFPHLADGKFNNLRKENGSGTPGLLPVNRAKLKGFALQAATLGLNSESIERLLSYPEDPTAVDAYFGRPDLSNDYLDLPEKARYNRPMETAYNRDRKRTFWDLVFETEPTERKMYATTFAVLRDIVFRFLAYSLPKKLAKDLNADELAHLNAQYDVQGLDYKFSSRRSAGNSPNSSVYSRSVDSPEIPRNARNGLPQKKKSWEEMDIAEEYMEVCNGGSADAMALSGDFPEDQDTGQTQAEGSSHNPTQSTQMALKDLRHALRISENMSVDTNESQEWEDTEHIYAPDPDIMQKERPIQAHSLALQQDHEQHCEEGRNDSGQSTGASQEEQHDTNSSIEFERQFVEAEAHIISTGEVVDQGDVCSVEDGSANGQSRATELADAPLSPNSQGTSSHTNDFQQSLLPNPRPSFSKEAVRKDEHLPEFGNNCRNKEEDQRFNQRDTIFPGRSSQLPQPLQLEMHADSGSGNRRTWFPGPALLTPAGLGKYKAEPALVENQYTKHALTSRKRKAVEAGRSTQAASTKRYAQVIDRDNNRFVVEAVRQVWDQLSHNRIYITSAVDIEGLRTRLHASYARLWSWSAQERDQFEADLNLCVKNGFQLQLASIENHPNTFHYHSDSPAYYWTMYFENREPEYWLGILSQPANTQANVSCVSDYYLNDRRRKRDEDGGDEIVVPTPQSSQQAQRADWDTFSVEVETVRSVWDQLDDSRIYITSTVDIPELDRQLHAEQDRLWSWSEQDYGHFQSQMDAILSQDFVLQLVSSDQHPQGRHYHSASPREFWTIYFREDIVLYWLAVIVPRRTMGESSKKVRRTNIIGLE